MNLENFAEYLKYPSRLYQLPYEELKSLTLQYPYCANFHVLLLIKSKLEGHPDLEKNLARAATYSVDRTYLRKLMSEEQLLPVDSQISIGEDEVLELKDLFSLDAELEKIPLSDEIPASETPLSSSISFEEPDSDDLFSLAEEPVAGENPEEVPSVETPTESFSEPELEPQKVMPPVPEDVADEEHAPKAAVVSPAPYVVLEELILHIGTIVEIAHLPATTTVTVTKKAAPQVAETVVSETLIADCVATSLSLDDFWERQARRETTEWEWDLDPVKTETPAPAPRPKPAAAPTPKTRFKSFQKRYHRPPVLDTQENETIKEQEVKPSVPPKEVAAESLRDDLGIASETLAGLLVQQHQYHRAIQMYEHLSLLIPEKNAYFAAKIDEIKNI